MEKIIFKTLSTPLGLFLNRSWWKFQWRYLRRQTPWDTQITPPEVMEFIAATPAGKALDLGCGTGTNAITLTRHGWRVTGVDFAERAIRDARRKADRAGLRIDFHIADVSRLEMIDDIFDYALDIGCLFALPAEARARYAETLARLVRPGGWYMLYAWLPRQFEGRTIGLTPEMVDALFSSEFNRKRIQIGQEKGHASAWYWFQKSAS